MSAPKSKFPTKKACIAELKRVQAKLKDEVISRNMFRIHSACTDTDYERHFGNFGRFAKAAGIPRDMLAERQKETIGTYCDLVDKKKAHPTPQELSARGISEDQVRHRFGGFKRLREAAREMYPEIFADIIDDSIFNSEHLSALVGEVARHKCLIFTTAVTGCPVDKNALAALKSLCKEYDAFALIMHCTDPAARVPWGLDSCLKQEMDEGWLTVVTQKFKLNSNLVVSTIKMSPKQMDPSTSLPRQVQKLDASLIAASPKQRLLPVSRSVTAKMPHMFMTTGAITKPRYQSDRYMSDRTADIAESDHVMGALIVELVDDKRFHFRQVQFEKSGGFADFGTYFKGGTIGSMSPMVAAFGDYHVGETDPVAEKAAKEIVVDLGIETIVLHDFCNALSVNPHEKKNAILRAMRADAGLLSLENELRLCAQKANELAELKGVKRLVFVESNHNDMIRRYLKNCEYIDDPHNHRFALKLALAMFERSPQPFVDANPVQVGMELLGFKYPNKAVWLTRNDSFKIGGIEYGAHGDRGVNGQYGPSMQGVEKAYGSSVTGHRHYSEIFGAAYSVATLSKLRLAYNDGVSTWMHSICLGYGNGQRQLIHILPDGSYRLGSGVLG